MWTSNAEDTDTYLPKTFQAWWIRKAVGFVSWIFLEASPHPTPARSHVKCGQLKALVRLILPRDTHTWGLELGSVFELQHQEHLGCFISHYCIFTSCPVQGKFPSQVICLLWTPHVLRGDSRNGLFWAALFWVPNEHSQLSRTSYSNTQSL